MDRGSHLVSGLEGKDSYRSFTGRGGKA